MTARSPLTRRPSGAALERPASIPLSERLTVDTEELGLLMGCAGRSIRDHLPDLPRLRVGRLVLFPVDGVRQWLIDNARPGEATELPSMAPDEMGAADGE